MIAVAILAWSSCRPGLRTGQEDVMKAERFTTATLLAKRLMTETLIKKPQLPAEDEGEFPEDVYGDVYKDYSWKKTIAPTPIPQVMEVRIAVLWKEGERFDMVELVSMNKGQGAGAGQSVTISEINRNRRVTLLEVLAMSILRWS
jgi:hypothetical protein